MKNSTKILGIILAVILILMLVAIFSIKAFLDSKQDNIKSSKNWNFNFDNLDIFNNSTNGSSALSNLDSISVISAGETISSLDDVQSIENKFFTLVDEKAGEFPELIEENKLLVDKINKDYSIKLNACKFVCIFTDTEKPYIKYRIYSNVKNIKNPVKMRADEISLLSENFYDNKGFSINFNKTTLVFAFIVLPKSYSNLRFSVNACSGEIIQSNLSIDENLTLNSNASKLNIFLQKVEARNLIFSCDAGLNDFNIDEMNVKNNISFETNTGKYNILINKFIVVPEQIKLENNAGSLSLVSPSVKAFDIDADVSAAAVTVSHNERDDTFSSNFRLTENSKNLDEKNIFHLNLDVSAGKITLAFE
ncbi:MAG TPA: hypothetical protein PLI56_04630 [Exilispira sp.]|nr:hypothetical protein [Exilispira sp.]